MQKTSSTLNSRYVLTRLLLTLSVALGLSVGIRLMYPIDTDISAKVNAAKRNQFIQAQTHINAISLGNSHSIGLNFDSIGLQGMHFFATGGDIEETLFKADALVDNIPGLDYVLLALSPGSLQFSQRYLPVDYTKRRLQISRDLPFEIDLETISLGGYIASIVGYLFPVEELQGALYAQIGYSKAEIFVDRQTRERCIEYLPIAPDSQRVDGVLLEDGIVGGYRRALIKQPCIAEFATRSAYTNLERTTRSLAEAPDIGRANVRRLKQLATSLARRDAQLVIVHPPLTRAYYESPYLQQLVPEFQMLVSELSEHPNVMRFDFHDLFFESADSDRNTLFYDDNHLALPGTIVFGEVLGRAMGTLPDLMPTAVLN